LLGFALFDRTGRSATHNAPGQATPARAEQSLYAPLADLPGRGDRGLPACRARPCLSAIDRAVAALAAFLRDKPPAGKS
jgi:hypothetical protein